MSSTDEDARHGDERPMLIIGEDRPDVEDTTPEELRRQREEAQREIAEARRRAQEEIERKRREAERELAELERAKEREIARRQRELDEAERTLYKRETRLRRKVSASGGTPKARLVEKPPRVPLSQKGLRRSSRAITVAAATGVALVVGLFTAAPGGGPDVRTEIVDTDRSRVLWLQSGLAADEMIAQRMAGREVAPEADGTWPNVRLAQEASAVYPGRDFYADRAEESTARMMAEGTTDVRALTLWSEVHREAGYAVGPWEVEDLVEEARGPDGWSYLLLGAGVLGLVALAVLALVARSWVSLPVLVVATGLAVAALSVVAAGNAEVRGAAAAHESADDALDEVHDQLGRDLEVAYGISTSSYAQRPEFWTDDPFYGDEVPGAQTYLAARQDMADSLEQGEQAVAEAAVGLVDAAREAIEGQVPALESARGRLVGTMAGSRSDWGLGLGLGLGAVVVGAAGVALSGGRGRTE